MLIVIGWCGTRRLLLSIHDSWDHRGCKIYGAKRGQYLDYQQFARTPSIRPIISSQRPVLRRDTANPSPLSTSNWNPVRAQPSVISQGHMGFSMGILERHHTAGTSTSTLCNPSVCVHTCGGIVSWRDDPSYKVWSNAPPRPRNCVTHPVVARPHKPSLAARGRGRPTRCSFRRVLLVLISQKLTPRSMRPFGGSGACAVPSVSFETVLSSRSKLYQTPRTFSRGSCGPGQGRRLYSRRCSRYKWGPFF